MTQKRASEILSFFSYSRLPRLFPSTWKKQRNHTQKTQKQKKKQRRRVFVYKLVQEPKKICFTPSSPFPFYLFFPHEQLVHAKRKTSFFFKQNRKNKLLNKKLTHSAKRVSCSY